MKHRYMIIVYYVGVEDEYKTYVGFFDHYEDVKNEIALADRCSYEWQLYKYHNSKEVQGYVRYK